jgi:hypothetical protein
MIIKSNLCKCGCGELCEQNWIRGHARRGRKNSEEQNRKIGLANKGRIMSEEVCKKNSERNIGRKMSDETKKKMSDTHKRVGTGKWMKGRTLPQATRDKVSKANIGRINTEETNEKIRQTKIGARNGMFGKTHSDEYKAILRQTIRKIIPLAHTDEAIEKRRLLCIGKKASDDTKRKMRISKINYIINGNGGIAPMCNIRACKYLDELSKINNWNLKHGLNGGEFHVKELGYFVDGYDESKNIVVEYDEPLHYNHKGLKQKDVKRQEEIIQLLNCKFFRYNEKIDLLYEVNC